MTFVFRKKGSRTVDLIRAIRTAGVIVPGGQVTMKNERPAQYVGPAGVESGIQMHTFRLYDGTEILLEVPALTDAMTQAARLPEAVGAVGA